jgi:hypothetical protein
MKLTMQFLGVSLLLSSSVLVGCGDSAADTCGAYFDKSVRDALTSAEENAQRYPNIPATTSLGVGNDRAAWVAGCGALPADKQRCFTEYAATHRDECLAVLLTPPPELQVAPATLSLDELRTLASSLPAP